MARSSIKQPEPELGFQLPYENAQAVTTGLRRSELFALKWKDVDFHTKQICVTRSIVQNVVGVCKTESSQKPVPAHDDLLQALREWHRQTPYQSPESWVFASPVHQGRWPYLAQEIMRHHIRPVARKLAITKRIGWHTFRHYADLLTIPGATEFGPSGHMTS